VGRSTYVIALLPKELDLSRIENFSLRILVKLICKVGSILRLSSVGSLSLFEERKYL